MTETRTDERSLGDYLARIAADPDAYRTVSRTVDPAAFDVTGLLGGLDQHRRYEAVHFRNPLDLTGRPSQFSVLANLFATRSRIAQMLHLNGEDVGPELGLQYGELVNRRTAPQLVPAGTAPVHECVLRGEDATMSILPVVRHAEMDLGPVLTMAHVMKGPDDGFYNVTFAKTFPDETGRRGGVTIHTPDLSRLLREWEARGRRFPVVNVLGHHPAFWLGSLAVTPYGTNEYETIGGFLGHPLRLTPSVTWGEDFLVPADAEIVIEGVVHTADTVAEGPFGEFTYYYGKATAPRCEITAISHRRDAIFHDVHPTHAEHRCLWLFPGREARLLAAVRAAVPGTSTVRIPFMGGSLSGYLSIAKAHDSDGQQAILAAFAADHFLKHVIAVDTDVDLMNDQEVLWALNVRFQADRDLVRLTGAKGIRMDPSATVHPGAGAPQALTAKLGFDATKPLTSPFPPRADTPAPGFERYAFTDWFGPSDSARLTAQLAARRALAE